MNKIDRRNKETKLRQEIKRLNNLVKQQSERIKELKERKK